VPTLAQGPNRAPNTKSRIEYHGGVVIPGPKDVYFIFYGCWSNTCGKNGSADTVTLLADLASNVGATPYFALNTLYPNGSGQEPNGQLFFGSAVFDPNYSHGLELTVDDIQAIVAYQIENHRLPQDSNGIYVVVASADVGANAAGFCTAVNTPIHHGNALAFGSEMRYAFLGNPNRCPAIAGPQFVAPNGVLLPTPNDDFAGDVIASDLAHVLSTTITDPFGDAWYDRYGLESAAKCQGTFGTPYTTASGARANVHFGQRDYLIQQNWVNDKKGRCAMQLSQ